MSAAAAQGLPLSACRKDNAVVPVSVKNNPPEKKTPWKISFRSTKSGAREEFLLLDCRASAKGVFFSDTDMGLTAFCKEAKAVFLLPLNVLTV